MAKQSNYLPMEGTLGNLTYLKTQDGYRVRQKSTLNGDRIKRDPAFERTRENISEFKLAANAGRLIRSAIRGLLKKDSDSRVISRLQGAMLAALKSDTFNPRGFRTVTKGKLDGLKRFEFNERSPLATIIRVPMTTAIDRVSGKLTLSLPQLVPADMLAGPTGATHCRIVLAGIDANFDKHIADMVSANSASIPWNRDPLPATNLEVHVAPNSVNPLFLLVGIEFYQEMNGDLYQLKNKASYGLSILQLSTV